MKHVRTVCAILLAIPMLVFGGNYFLKLFALPEGDGSAGAELLQSMRDGGLMAVIAASHVLVGVLLLPPRTRFFAGVMQLPMSIGIVSFHATMLPAGLGVAIAMLVLNLGVISSDRLKSLMFGSA